MKQNRFNRFLEILSLAIIFSFLPDTAWSQGDINCDGQVNLEDAITALQVLSGIQPSATICKQADVNRDQKIGTEDIIYIFQLLSLLRADITPPTVLATSPANGATSVTTNTSITATFSEAMDPASITATTFTVSGVTGTVSSSGAAATFTPLTSLSYNTTYTATITKGAKDTAGNTIPANHTWSFTTEPGNVLQLDGLDDRAEANSSIFPNTSTAHSFTVEAWIYPTASGTFIATDDAYDLILFYQPGAANNGIGINFKLWETCSSSRGITEFRGVTLNQWNHIAAMVDASLHQFVIAINGIISSSPTTYAANTFCSDSNQRFTVGGYYASNSSTFEGKIDDVRVSDTPHYNANFTPSLPLTYDTNTKGLWHFDERINSTDFSDSSGNSNTLTGLNGAQTIAVSLDTTPLRVSSTSPINGATNVSINTSVSATFSETMDTSTITPATFALKQGSTFIPGTVTYSGTRATFTPSSNLAYSTTYTGIITTAVMDLAGNAMAQNYTWSFTTASSVDVAGNWSGNWISSGGGYSGSLSVALVQSGTSITGAASITSSPCISSGSISGTVFGDNVAFGVVSGADTIAFSATYTSNAIIGIYSVTAGSCFGEAGTFSMSK